MKTILSGKGISSKASSASLASGQSNAGGDSPGCGPSSGPPRVGGPVTQADIAAVNQAVVDSWLKTFDNVLSHKVGLDLFRQFLRSEFSEENIEFWIACENYRLLPESNLEDSAREIFENFVTELAPKEVKIIKNLLFFHVVL